MKSQKGPVWCVRVTSNSEVATIKCRSHTASIPSPGKKAEKLGQRQSRLGFRMKVGMLRLGGILFQRMGFLLLGMGILRILRRIVRREWFGLLLQ